jgi:hypothetical protein
MKTTVLWVKEAIINGKRVAFKTKDDQPVIYYKYEAAFENGVIGYFYSVEIENPFLKGENVLVEEKKDKRNDVYYKVSKDSPFTESNKKEIQNEITNPVIQIKASQSNNFEIIKFAVDKALTIAYNETTRANELFDIEIQFNDIVKEATIIIKLIKEITKNVSE